MKNTEHTERKRAGQNSKVIRIDLELVEKLDDLARITRTPIKEIASNAIRFDLQYAVTKPVECYDVEFLIADRESK